MYDPSIHHRRSIRLQNWDYSWTGKYFITMKVNANTIIFGEVINGKMLLNEFGQICAETWIDLPNHYPNIRLDSWIVMPDHFHGIVEITAVKNDDRTPSDYFMDNMITATKKSFKICSKFDSTEYRDTRRKMLLSRIIGMFKMRSAKEINLICHSSGKIWQRDYYEQIIRDPDSLCLIRKYIRKNPENYVEKK